jgi:hypothetical protein
MITEKLGRQMIHPLTDEWHWDIPPLRVSPGGGQARGGACRGVLDARPEQAIAACLDAPVDRCLSGLSAIPSQGASSTCPSPA